MTTLEHIFEHSNLVEIFPNSIPNVPALMRITSLLANPYFPYAVDSFRFSMRFSPLLEDLLFRDTTDSEQYENYFMIGHISYTQVFGRRTKLQKYGLDRFAGILEVQSYVERLKSEGLVVEENIDIDLLNMEVQESERICCDLQRGGEIISLNPQDYKISFFNSSIKKLLKSLISYQKNIYLLGVTKQNISKLQRELFDIDKSALDSKDNVWIKVIESLEIEV